MMRFQEVKMCDVVTVLMRMEIASAEREGERKRERERCNSRNVVLT